MFNIINEDGCVVNTVETLVEADVYVDWYFGYFGETLIIEVSE